MMLVVIFFVMTLKQCGMKKDVKKSFDERIELFRTWEDHLNEGYTAEIEVLKDSIDYFKQLVDYNSNKANKANRQVRQLKSEYAALSPQMEQIPFDSSGAFITGLYEPTDTLQYLLSGNQAREIHLDLLQGIKAKAIVKELTLENFYLDESLRASGDLNVQMSKENELLEKAIQDYQVDLLESKLKEKTLKRKVWTNRGIAGAAIVIGVAILL